MSINLNRSHDPQRQSWVASANVTTSDFPIQNLPWCVVDCQHTDGVNQAKVCTRIGDVFLPLSDVYHTDLLNDLSFVGPDLFAGSYLSDRLLSLSVSERSQLRLRLSDLLHDQASNETQAQLRPLLQESQTLHMPIQVGDYTDFYASVHHATNVGTMFRPLNPLLPNYKWIPVGYHGRASSVVSSGTEIRRPVGQQIPLKEGEKPRFGACMLLDYELEMGIVVGAGNKMGDVIDIAKAPEHIIGLCLLNDWSARDLQKWEYQPLGPFLAKNFATSISPYIVTLEALAPFRVPAEQRAEGDPQPLEYLSDAQDQQSGCFDIQLEVFLSSEKMRAADQAPIALSKNNFKAMYWTIAQMLTHHSTSGCNLRAGDLLGSGTVSGPTRNERGCLLELTWDGSKDNPLPGTQRTPLQLPSGEERKFLANGDEVTIKGSCHKEGARRIGFGNCSGRILPARNF
jgi:fumarylacetoacetase